MCRACLWFSILLQGRYFQDEKQDSEDYWLTVTGNTVGRHLVQAQAESPDTFRHSPSPSQVSAALLGLTMALVTGVVLSSQKDPCCRIFTKASSAHCVRHHDMEPQRNYAQECGLGPKGMETSGWHVTMLQNWQGESYQLRHLSTWTSFWLPAWLKPTRDPTHITAEMPQPHPRGEAASQLANHFLST